MTADEWLHFDWARILRCEHTPKAGATEEVIALGAQRTFRPITWDKIREVRNVGRNPFFTGTSEYNAWLPTDASEWVFPTCPFPLSYLSLIRWANGGDFRIGVNRFFRLTPIEGIRDHMLDLPFAQKHALGCAVRVG